jgi:hypothetical protein
MRAFSGDGSSCRRQALAREPLLLAKNRIDRPTAPAMQTRRAEVFEDVRIRMAASFFQRVSKDRDAVKIAICVDGLGQSNGGWW